MDGQRQNVAHSIHARRQVKALECAPIPTVILPVFSPLLNIYRVKITRALSAPALIVGKCNSGRNHRQRKAGRRPSEGMGIIAIGAYTVLRTQTVAIPFARTPIRPDRVI